MIRSLAIALILVLSSSASADDWSKYKKILNQAEHTAKFRNGLVYMPPYQEGCSSALEKLKAISKRMDFDIMVVEGEMIRIDLFPDLPPEAIVHGAVLVELKIIFLNVSMTSCGMARTLAHELGHVVSFGVAAKFSEVSAELIQFGVMKKIGSVKYDTERSTSNYLSQISLQSGKQVLSSKDSDENSELRRIVYAGVNELTR